jgi:hypothetical protein
VRSSRSSQYLFSFGGDAYSYEFDRDQKVRELVFVCLEVNVQRYLLIFYVGQRMCLFLIQKVQILRCYFCEDISEEIKSYQRIQVQLESSKFTKSEIK